MRKTSILFALPLWAGLAAAAAPEQTMRELEAAARRDSPAFKAFSAARGEQFYRSERAGADGGKISCASCHTADPRALGKTRAHKEILPLAPGANRERFTDPAKVDKWFRRNCNDVLGRACTAVEKGDFLAWLLSVK